MFLFDMLLPLIVIAIFAFATGVFARVLVKDIRTNRKNDAAPRVTAGVTVVTKRTQVQGDHAHTTYFATFQFESGDRLEMQIPHDRFGYLVEGDKGELTFQGTRYLDFQRQ